MIDEKETEILNDLVVALKLKPDSSEEGDGSSESSIIGASGTSTTLSSEREALVDEERIMDGVASPTLTSTALTVTTSTTAEVACGDHQRVQQ